MHFCLPTKICCLPTKCILCPEPPPPPFVAETPSFFAPRAFFTPKRLQLFRHIPDVPSTPASLATSSTAPLRRRTPCTRLRTSSAGPRPGDAIFAQTSSFFAQTRTPLYLSLCPDPLCFCQDPFLCPDPPLHLPDPSFFAHTRSSFAHIPPLQSQLLLRCTPPERSCTRLPSSSSRDLLRHHPAPTPAPGSSTSYLPVPRNPHCSRPEPRPLRRRKEARSHRRNQ